jgi:hypothetical protein
MKSMWMWDIFLFTDARALTYTTNLYPKRENDLH